jgi:serine O-acetyltransferase
MIGAGAKLFGPVVVGDNSQIGGGAVVLKNIPENSIVVGNPARVVKREGISVMGKVDTVNLPDPIKDRIQKLEKSLRELERNLPK